MIRLLLFLLLFFLGYTLYQAVARILFPPSSKGPEATREGEEMVRDPQCGTFVPRSGAVTRTINGEKHFFCSKKCRDAYPGKK